MREEVGASACRTGGWRPFAASVLFLCAGSGVAAAAETTRPHAVVELFTSQGCANCPPADALLTELSSRRDVVALSFPVDYWDYLGWKDTAAKPEFTRRQRAYADRRGDHEVYTPQMVINGGDHVIGSDRAAIDAELAGAGAPLPVDIEVERTGDTLVVEVGDAPATEATPPRATVWMVRFDRLRSVPIKRGENGGRTLAYTNLVRALEPIGMWKGRAIRIELPRNEVVHDGNEGCAVLVQTDRDDGPGPIVGARLVARAER